MSDLVRSGSLSLLSLEQETEKMANSNKANTENSLVFFIIKIFSEAKIFYNEPLVIVYMLVVVV